jgi:hypothetical protein
MNIYVVFCRGFIFVANTKQLKVQTHKMYRLEAQNLCFFGLLLVRNVSTRRLPLKKTVLHRTSGPLSIWFYDSLVLRSCCPLNLLGLLLSSSGLILLSSDQQDLFFVSLSSSGPPGQRVLQSSSLRTPDPGPILCYPLNVCTKARTGLQKRRRHCKAKKGGQAF